MSSCRCRSARSGSAASSGNCAAAPSCRCTIRNSTRRSAESSNEARRQGRLTDMANQKGGHHQNREHPGHVGHFEHHENPAVHHEESDVNIRAILGFGGGLIVVAAIV